MDIIDEIKDILIHWGSQILRTIGLILLVIICILIFSNIRNHQGRYVDYGDEYMER